MDITRASASMRLHLSFLGSFESSCQWCSHKTFATPMASFSCCVSRCHDFDTVRTPWRRALTGVILVELAVDSVDEESTSDVLDL